MATGDGMPELSTVVVTWRNADVIGRCLAAIEQGAIRRSQEVIVVDNGSDDATSAAAAAAAPSIRIVRLAGNVGFAAAANSGLSIARGRFAALVNSDCFPDPGALDALVDALDENPGLGIVGGRLRYEDGRHQASAGSLPTLRSELWLALGLHVAPLTRQAGVGILAPESLYRSSRPVGWVSAAFCAARREVGPVPESAFLYGEDVEWAAQAGQREFEVRLEPHATAVHLNGYSVRRSHPPGYREARRVESSLRWFASRGAVSLAAERGILALHAVLRLAAATALIPFHGRRGVVRFRRFATLLRAALARQR